MALLDKEHQMIPKIILLITKLLLTWTDIKMLYKNCMICS